VPLLHTYRNYVLPPSVRARVAIGQRNELPGFHIGGERKTLTMFTFEGSASIGTLQVETGFSGRHSQRGV
jgi:hypothetical protein